MKRTNLIILFLSFFCVSIFAEEADTTIFAVTYLTDFKEAEEQKEISTDDMILEVSQKQTSFYSRWQRMRQERFDSLEKQGITDPHEVVARAGDIPRSYFHYRVISNCPTNGVRTVFCKHMQDLYYEEPMELQEWQIDEGDSILLDYHCKKATCMWRGHKWNVWFTPEIPVSAGPWKLSGLPGLILNAYDENGMCTFNAIKIEKTISTEVYNPKTKALKSTRKQDSDLLKLRKSDIYEYMKRMGIPGISAIDENGKSYKIKSKKAVLLEDD